MKKGTVEFHSSSGCAYGIKRLSHKSFRMVLELCEKLDEQDSKNGEVVKVDIAITTEYDLLQEEKG